MASVAAALALLLPRVARGVPRESPEFDPELHVPDISSSEEAVPFEDRKESEVGCHWTARLQFSLCDSAGECHDAEVLAFDFQRRTWAYLESNRTLGGQSRAPPLECLGRNCRDPLTSVLASS